MVDYYSIGWKLIRYHFRLGSYYKSESRAESCNDNYIGIIIFYRPGIDSHYVIPAGHFVNPVNPDIESKFYNVELNRKIHVNNKMLCTTHSCYFKSISEAVSFIVGFDVVVKQADCDFYDLEEDYIFGLRYALSEDTDSAFGYWNIPKTFKFYDQKHEVCTRSLWNGYEQKRKFHLPSILALFSLTHKGEELKYLTNNAIVLDSLYNS